MNIKASEHDARFGFVCFSLARYLYVQQEKKEKRQPPPGFNCYPTVQMKAFLYLLPLLGSLALASPVDDKCQCPQVKCPADDPVVCLCLMIFFSNRMLIISPKKLCECLNSREKMCKEVCPKYVPTYSVSSTI